MSSASSNFQVQVTARVLVTRGSDLLLVSNDARIWYTPGGRLEPGESLHACARREVQEETGLQVSVGDLVYVFEYWEAEYRRHKVECFFVAALESGELDHEWVDLHGPVKHMRFFRPKDLQAEEHVYPKFLKKGPWRDRTSQVYMGFER